LSDSVTVGDKATLYASFSAALTLPVIAWPLMHQLFFTFFGENFYFSWVVSAGMVLLVVVVADSMCSGAASFRTAVISLAWILLIIVFVALCLSLWNSLYLMALIYFLHSLR